MEPLVVRRTVEIRADAAAVWDALTDPRKTRRFLFGAAVESDWRPGSAIRFTREVAGRQSVFVKGLILEIEAGRRLRFTVVSPQEAGSGVESAESVLTFEIQPQVRGTRLLVTQEGFEGPQRRRRFEETQAMWDQALPELKRLLES